MIFYLEGMKFLKFLFLLLSGICFFEVYYLHSKLSFIDTPYLYAGIVFLLMAALAHYITKRRSNA